MSIEPFQRASDFARSVDRDGGFHAANAKGSLFVMQSRFAAYEGVVHATPFLRIGLLVSGGGRYRQATEAGRIEADWRPGELVVIPPHLTGEGRCAAVDMIGFGIDVEKWSSGRSAHFHDRIHAAADRLHRDDLISSVLTALRHTAELHGCSTLFFEHGAELIAERVASLGGEPAVSRYHRLDAGKLARIDELIEARLGGDLSVAEMASTVNYEVSGFTRAFKLATGMTPHAYFTVQRLQRAAELLRGGHSVTSAAFAVGYANASKFAAAFRRRYRTSPSEWKRVHAP